MRSMMKWVALVGIGVALVAADVSAQGQGQGKGQGKRGGQKGQRGGGGFGGGGVTNMATLLGNAGVQTELKMTDDQKTKASDFAMEQAQAMRGAGGGGGGGGGGRRGGGGGGTPPDPAAVVARTKAANEAAEKFVKDNLKPEQGKRLKGIYYHNATLQVLATDEAAQKELNVTADQKTKFTSLNSDFTKDQTDLFAQLRGGGGGDPAETMQKVQQLRKDYTDKAVAALTDAQKKTWKDIVGEPYVVQLGGARRGGGGDN